MTVDPKSSIDLGSHWRGGKPRQHGVRGCHNNTLLKGIIMDL